MTQPEKPYSQHEFICEYLLALLADAKLRFESYSNTDYLRDKVELVTRLSHEGIGFATRTLPTLSESLLQHLSGRRAAYSGFKLTRAKDYPLFLKGLFFLAYDEDSFSHTLAIEWIYNFSNSFKKLKGPFKQVELQSQLNDFVEVDQLLPDDHRNEFDELVIDHARMFITDLFGPINEDENILLDGIVPRPGPGATNKPVALNRRFEPSVVHSVVDDVLPYAEWFYSSYNHFCWEIPRLRALKRSEPRSRFKFVEKQVGKARGICIEENEMQYFQQGVKHFLYQWIESHPLTKGKINFTDQSINAHLALHSSCTGDFATLDMKDASDRITRQLVAKLFSDVPFLADILDRLSTRAIDLPFEVNGLSTLMAKKFAPMGSGICFPIMSLVHYALIRSIIHLSMLPDRMIQTLHVYGDDIVVDVKCVQAIFDCLPRFGMKFNTNKSFYSGYFRESCGMHAYKGMNITPVYLKYTTGSRFASNVKYSVIQSEYDLYKKGYYNACGVLRKFHTDITITVKPACQALGWKRPHCSTPVGVMKRWNAKWHCIEFKVDCFVTISELDVMNDSPALLRWYSLRSHAHNDFQSFTLLKRRKRWLTLSDLV